MIHSCGRAPLREGDCGNVGRADPRRAGCNGHLPMEPRLFRVAVAPALVTFLALAACTARNGADDSNNAASEENDGGAICDEGEAVVSRERRSSDTDGSSAADANPGVDAPSNDDSENVGAELGPNTLMIEVPGQSVVRVRPPVTHRKKRVAWRFGEYSGPTTDSDLFLFNRADFVQGHPIDAVIEDAKTEPLTTVCVSTVNKDAIPGGRIRCGGETHGCPSDFTCAKIEQEARTFACVPNVAVRQPSAEPRDPSASEEPSE